MNLTLIIKLQVGVVFIPYNSHFAFSQARAVPRNKVVMGWEEVAPSAVMDWAGFEFASSVF